MQILSINEDDYLKCYFRSNGVALDVQHTPKNKYSKVFDSWKDLLSKIADWHKFYRIFFFIYLFNHESRLLSY